MEKLEWYMDVNKIMAAIKKQVTEKQDEILADFRHLVEQQYCPVHGKFAEFEGAEGELGSDEGVRLRFTTCCPALEEAVHQAVQARQSA